MGLVRCPPTGYLLTVFLGSPLPCHHPAPCSGLTGAKEVLSYAQTQTVESLRPCVTALHSNPGRPNPQGCPGEPADQPSAVGTPSRTLPTGSVATAVVLALGPLSHIQKLLAEGRLAECQV